MRIKLAGSVVAGLLAVLLLAPSAMAQKPAAAITPIDLAGSACTIPEVGTGTVSTGTLTVNRFTTQAGQLAAQVTVTATCVVQTATGTVTETATRTLTIPVGSASGSCQILDLVLGPLDLDLLGLVVELEQVELTITAERGPGNLLGNLLCAVAGALDAGAPANQIANLLNQILGILRL